MTAIGMFSTPYQTPNRLWLLDDHGTEYMPGVPIDLTLFNQSQHYPNGFIPSGTVLGKKTSGGKYGPYLSTNSDGTQNALGITFNDIDVYAPGIGTPTLLTIVSCPILVHGFVDQSKLPFTSGNAASGGYLDAGAITALKNIIFVPAVA